MLGFIIAVVAIDLCLNYFLFSINVLFPKKSSKDGGTFVF
jgi:hypothetical protein